VQYTKEELSLVNKEGTRRAYLLIGHVIDIMIKLDVSGEMKQLVEKSREYYKSKSDSIQEEITEKKRKIAHRRGCDCESGNCTDCSCVERARSCDGLCKCSHGKGKGQVTGTCINFDEADELKAKEYNKLIAGQVVTEELKATAEKEAERMVVAHYKQKA
jgi:hypothetical protein